MFAFVQYLGKLIWNSDSEAVFGSKNKRKNWKVELTNQ